LIFSNIHSKQLQVMPKLVQVNWILAFFSQVLSSYYFKPCEIASNKLRCLYHHLVSTCIGPLQQTQIASIMLRCLYHHLVSTCIGPLQQTQIASIMLRCLYHHLVSTCIGPLQLTQIASIMLRCLYHHLVSTCIGPLQLTQIGSIMLRCLYHHLVSMCTVPLTLNIEMRQSVKIFQHWELSGKEWSVCTPATLLYLHHVHSSCASRYR
jgi:hypothetical protein